MEHRKKLSLPVVSLSAEYLVIGHLLRRNILTYKAPPNNQGYDLLCTHPDPAHATKTLRVQVKSRYQTDCDRSFPVRRDSFRHFDYLVAVFLNVGLFFCPLDALPISRWSLSCCPITWPWTCSVPFSLGSAKFTCRSQAWNVTEMMKDLS